MKFDEWIKVNPNPVAGTVLLIRGMVSNVMFETVLLGNETDRVSTHLPDGPYAVFTYPHNQATNPLEVIDEIGPATEQAAATEVHMHTNYEYGLDVSRWDKALVRDDHNPHTERTCTCDFRGPNAFMGCRCGAIDAERNKS